MAFKIGDLFWKIKGDTKDIDNSLKTTDTKVSGLQGTFGKLGTFLKGAFVAAAVAGIAKVTKELVTAASDAEETRNKFNVVFRDIKDEANLAASSLADGFGLSQTKAEDLLSSTGDLLSGFGFTQASALDLSTQVNTLAADLASFTNFSGGAEGASQALTKGLLGEREAMKSLGISIQEADIKQLAEDKGIVGELDRQTKATLTLELAIKQSKNAIGDFARSQDSFANQSRIAKAEIENLGVELGKNVLPIATGAISVFAQVTGKLAELAAFSNEYAAAQKAVSEGTATTSQQLEVLNAKLKRQENTLKSTAGLTTVNAQALQSQIDATKEQIALAEKKLQAEKRAAGQRELGNLIAAEEAEKEAQRFAEEEARAAKRAAEIEYRNEIWGRTEEARRAAIEAEIAELETYSESDVKAQQALAFLREELEKFNDDTDDSEEKNKLLNDRIREGTNTLRDRRNEVDKNSDAVERLNTITVDWESLQTQAINSTLAGFTDLGAALYAGGNAYEAFGSMALKSISQVLKALGDQLAAQAVALLIGGNIPLSIAAGAGATAAYIASGAIGAAAADVVSTPTPTSTTPTPETTPTPTTGGGSRGGGTTTIEVPVYLDGKKIATATAPYLISELERRGDL